MLDPTKGIEVTYNAIRSLFFFLSFYDMLGIEGLGFSLFTHI